MNTIAKRPLLKVCGLTKAEDVALCHNLGVDFTGFIFVPGSPRAASAAQVAALPVGASKKVGVFAGAGLDSISETARGARLEYIQLHGGEDVELCAAVGPERVIKVLWPEAHAGNVAGLQEELDRFAPVCSWFLFDAGTSGGGSGKALDLPLFSQLRIPRPWLLAGGIGPRNLAGALNQCSPDGLDMNSALESAPGVKDHEKLAAAVKAARAHSPCGYSATGQTDNTIS